MKSYKLTLNKIFWQAKKKREEEKKKKKVSPESCPNSSWICLTSAQFLLEFCQNYINHFFFFLGGGGHSATAPLPHLIHLCIHTILNVSSVPISRSRRMSGWWTMPSRRETSNWSQLELTLAKMVSQGKSKPLFMRNIKFTKDVIFNN